MLKIEVQIDGTYYACPQVDNTNNGRGGNITVGNITIMCPDVSILCGVDAPLPFFPEVNILSNS